MTETGTQAATSTGADPGTATPKTDVTYVKAEDFEGRNKFVNDELKSRRKELEGLVAKIDALNEKLDSLKPVATATSDSKGPKDLEAAETARRVKTLEEKLAQAERERAEALISTAISEATKGVLPEVQEILQDSLRIRAKIDGDVVVVDTDDGPKRLNAEYVRSLKKSGGWFPASGRPGSGLTEVAGGAGSAGIDWNRVTTDHKYFEDNRAAILAETARRHKVAAGG